jgi:hypothetical protein
MSSGFERGMNGKRIIFGCLYPKTSSKMIQKGLAFPGEWSGTAIDRALGPSEILPPPASSPLRGFGGGGGSRRPDRRRIP